MERKRFSGVMLLFIVLAVVLITQVVGNLGRSGDVSYSDMRAYFTAEKVKSFTATDTRLVAKLQDGSSVSCALHPAALCAGGHGLHPADEPDRPYGRHGRRRRQR